MLPNGKAYIEFRGVNNMIEDKDDVPYGISDDDGAVDEGGIPSASSLSQDYNRQQ